MASLAVFAVFCSKLSANDFSSPAQILSRRPLVERKNSQMVAVLRCRTAVSRKQHEVLIPPQTVQAHCSRICMLESYHKVLPIVKLTENISTSRGAHALSFRRLAVQARQGRLRDCRRSTSPR